MHVFRRPYDYAVRNGQRNGQRRVRFTTRPSIAVESRSALSAGWLVQKTSAASFQDENLSEASPSSSNSIEWQKSQSSTDTIGLSYLKQQQIDIPARLEWKGSNVSDGTALPEWLKEHSIGSGEIIEWLTAKSHTNKLVVANVSQQHITHPTPLEWKGSVPFTTACHVKLEWLVSKVSGSPIVIEGLSGIIGNQKVPVAYASLVSGKDIVLNEWRKTLQISKEVSAEWLKALATESDVKSAWQKELIGVGSNWIEYLSERQSGLLVPIGWTGALAVITSHHINSEWSKASTSGDVIVIEQLIQVIPASKAPAGYSQLLSTISKIPTGWTAEAIFSAESVLPVSWATRVVLGSLVNVESTAGFSAEQKEVVEWLTRAGIAQDMITAYGVVIPGAADIPVEWSGADVVFVQGNVDIWYADQRGHAWYVPARGFLWN